MMSLLLALSVPLILAGHPSYAAPTKIAPAVVAKARAMEAQCRARGGKIDHTSKPVAFIDVNRDGRPDYLFDENAVVCQGAPDTFAAGDGPHVEVFIADATGDAQSVFRVPAKGMRIERAADGGIVKLMVAGTACDAKASASLAPTCERTLVWNATTQKLGLAPLPSAVAAKPARLPPTVAAMVKSLEKECRDSGGKPASGKFPIGVDLNGDGLVCSWEALPGRNSSSTPPTVRGTRLLPGTTTLFLDMTSIDRARRRCCMSRSAVARAVTRRPRRSARPSIASGR